MHKAPMSGMQSVFNSSEMRWQFEKFKNKGFRMNKIKLDAVKNNEKFQSCRE